MLTCNMAEQATTLETMIFQTSHSLDMKYTDIDSKGEYHLGYSREELFQTSWYQLIHPDDVALASNKHMEMMRSGGAEIAQSLCLRLQTKVGCFVWVHVVMRLSGAPFGPLGAPESAPQEILCLNHVISEAEVYETRSRDSWEELMSAGGVARNGSFEPQQQQLRDEAYLPTIVVSEGFLDQATADEEFARPPQVSDCNRQELMRKLRCKAQQKRSKRARMDDGNSVSFDSFESRGGMTAGNGHQYVPDVLQGNLNFSSSQMTMRFSSSPRSDLLSPPECYQGPMTPAYSDDGYSTDCTIMHYSAPASSEFTSASCTPPYSPPSNFSYLDEAPSHTSYDDSSFFESNAAVVKPVVIPARASSVSRPQQKFLVDDLPELDQCLVASFLDGVESKVTSVLPSYSSLVQSGGSSARQWVANAELFLQPCPVEPVSLSDDDQFLPTHEGRHGVQETRAEHNQHSDVSFMDMINEPLFFETIDMLSTAGQLQFC
jgi:hypothetical protein